MELKPLGTQIFALFPLLLLLSVSTALPNSVNETFIDCISLHTSNSTKISSFLFTQNASTYSSILHSSIQNLRFNSSTIPKPQFIITPRKEFQIQAAVICSRKHGLKIRVRSGGHDYEGLSYMSDTPFVIIDLVHRRSINVNVKNSTAWVQAGATLGEVYYKIANKSRTLAFAAGVCPTIGVGGHISGGGMGTLMRKYGLAADNVVDARIVDVNGRILDRKSMGEDLFWAIRGGGGASFGIIHSWKINLVPVPPKVTVFTVHKTLEQGATKLVERWQQIADKFHENLFIRIIVTSVLNKDKKGGKTVQAAFNSLFLGSAKELLPLMNNSFPELGLEAKDCWEMSWIETILYFNDGYPKGETIDVLMDKNHVTKGFFKAKSDFVTKPISEIGLEGIWKFFLEDNPSVMILDPYGARMSKILESETPFPHRAEMLYNIQYLVKWYKEEDNKSSKRHIDWISRLYDYMSPYVSNCPRRAYLNYRDLDLGRNEVGNTSYLQATAWGSKYFKNNFKRLAIVKGMVDPSNFFSDEQSIPPLIFS